MNRDIPASFESLLGPGHIRTDTDPPVLLPPDETVLSAVIGKACSDVIPVTVFGGKTLSGFTAAVDGIVVSTARIAHTIEPDPGDFVTRISAGVSPEQAESAVGDTGLLLPLDMGSADKATMGGAFMADARSGLESGYGPFRDAVVGLRCVTADGSIVTGGGRTAKNVTGYDLPRFFAGTRGLFGVCFELTVRTPACPESRTVIVMDFADGSGAAACLDSILSSRMSPSFLEMTAPGGVRDTVTIEAGIDGLRDVTARTVESIRVNEGRDAVSAKTHSYAENRRSRRKLTGRFFTGAGISVTLPPAAMPSMIERLGNIDDSIPFLAFPRAGKLYLAENAASRMHDIGNASRAVGGRNPVTITDSGRTGIAGRFSDTALALVGRLKRELDPKNILNPHLLA